MGLARTVNTKRTTSSTRTRIPKFNVALVESMDIWVRIAGESNNHSSNKEKKVQDEESTGLGTRKEGK
eukprot:3462026-Prorocentrum_lima.AAC.1